MIQIVYTDLKPLIHKITSKMRLNFITFRDKIEGRSETERLFQARQSVTPFRPPRRVHIVCEDESEPFPLRPSRPPCRRCPGTFVDRPDVLIFFHPYADDIPPEE